jgi:uncharacterized membrane protein
VLGILALCVVGLELFGYLSGLIGLIVMSMSAAEFDLTSLAGPAYRGMPWVAIAVVLFDFSILCTLCVAAIGMLKRRRYGVKAARAFAMMFGFFFVVNGVLTLLNLDQIRNEPGLGDIPIQIPIENLFIIGTVLAMQFGICIPVTIIAWFGSHRAKREWTSWA